MVYDDGRKNIKITIFSDLNDKVDNIIDAVMEESYNVVTIDTIDKMTQNIIKGKVKIVVVFDDKYISKIKELDSNIVIIVLDIDKKIARTKSNTLDRKYKVVNSIEELMEELDFCVRIVNTQEKVNFQNYKINLVSNLVESIAHNIQGSLLLVGASMDVIKILAKDKEIAENDQMREMLDSMTQKNNNSLDKANLLLEILSNATSVSNESVMQCGQIEDIIRLILDEYIKENGINILIESKIREEVYICGPLNDIIFILCSMIKCITSSDSKEVKLTFSEDENAWYLTLFKADKIEIKEELIKLFNFVTFVKYVKYKNDDNNIVLKLDKIKE